MRLKGVLDLPSDKENKKYFINQTVLTFNGMASPPNVDRSKSSERGRKRCSNTKIEVVTTDRNGFSREQQFLLYKYGMLSHVVEKMKRDILTGTVPSVPSTPQNVKKINLPTCLEEYFAAQDEKRKKANDGGQSASQVAKALGGKVKQRNRKSWR